MGKCLAEPCVGLLEFGDLALQAIDFREYRGDVFGVSCLDRSDTTTASPVAQTAAIRAEALVGSGRGVGVAAVLAHVSTCG